MEAGILLRPISWIPKQPLKLHTGSSFLRCFKSFSNSLQSEKYSVPKQYEIGVRKLRPNSQSRADLLALGLAVTNILAGLVWLSIRPKSISKVDPEGVDCYWISPYLPDYVVSELEWFWQSLSTVTCCRSLVIVYDGICILQVGVAAKSSTGGEAENVDASKLLLGTLYGGIMKSGSQSYLANLSLYPGKSELPFLPPNTQAVILQPLGETGIAVIGGDTIRGFTTADQAWISLIGDKLDATLAKSVTRTAFLAQDRG